MCVYYGPCCWAPAVNCVNNVRELESRTDGVSGPWVDGMGDKAFIVVT